jgi:hypothetical protein
VHEGKVRTKGKSHTLIRSGPATQAACVTSVTRDRAAARIMRPHELNRPGWPMSAVISESEVTAGGTLVPGLAGKPGLNPLEGLDG